MDVRFHWSRRANRSLKKSRHAVAEQKGTVETVLALRPFYGVPVARHGRLRKMRVAVPSLRIGKSGGYRLIYRAELIDEWTHVVFLDVFFKGKTADLSEAEYANLDAEADEILGHPLDYEWTNAPRT